MSKCREFAVRVAIVAVVLLLSLVDLALGFVSSPHSPFPAARRSRGVSSFLSPASGFYPPPSLRPFPSFFPHHSSSPSSSPPFPRTTVETTDCLIVGGGLSGSTTAFRLSSRSGGVGVGLGPVPPYSSSSSSSPSSLLLAESGPVLGGCVSSRSLQTADGEFIWEDGPNSFQPSQSLMALVQDLNLADELVLADGSLPRYILWEGGGSSSVPASLHRLPMSVADFATGFTLLSMAGKARLALGLVGLAAGRRAPMSGARPPDEEETVKDFMQRHLGLEAFERVVDPFVSGVYAGDPERLSMRSALGKIHRLEGLGAVTGLLPGMLARMDELKSDKAKKPVDPKLPTYEFGQLGSFKKGMQTLTDAIAERLGPNVLRLGHTLTSVSRSPTGGPSGDRGGDFPFVSTFSTPSGVPHVIKSKCLSIAVPAYAAARVLSPGLLPRARSLADVSYPTVASVTAAYRNSEFRTDLPGGGNATNPLVGFGHLIPRAMKVRSLGSIWTTSLFPGRAPKGWSVVTTFVGGARDDVSGLSEELIAYQADVDVRKILLKDGAKEGMLLGCKIWKNAIPQYDVGHKDILEAVEKDEYKVPGLFVGGNFRHGVAIGDCVDFGIAESERIAGFLRSRRGDAL